MPVRAQLEESLFFLGPILLPLSNQPLGVTLVATSEEARVW